MPNNAEHELRILEEIERNPETTQATLAAQLGVAVGSINFVIKRLVNKGYVHVKQLQRRRLKYIITPKGLALRSKLAKDSLQYSMRLYRETRATARQFIAEVERRGGDQLAIRGDSELAEVVALTCLEMNIAIRPEQANLPVIVIVDTSLQLEWPESITSTARTYQ